jgi:4-hydroxy-3-polyprenylbenzoate decarboxylase
MTQPPRKIFLGVSGASGAPYALRTLQLLVAAGAQVDLVYSPSARRVLLEECGVEFDGRNAAALLAPGQDPRAVRCHDHANIGAPPASGSALGEAALIVPCSLTTLAGIAEGRAGNLIERAAQVALKEGRKLVIVPRESPLARTHLDQLSRLAWAGATILPASPGFYHRPQSIADLVDQVCAKILGVIGIPQQQIPPWNGGVGS